MWVQEEMVHCDKAQQAFPEQSYPVFLFLFLLHPNSTSSVFGPVHCSTPHPGLNQKSTWPYLAAISFSVSGQSSVFASISHRATEPETSQKPEQLEQAVPAGFLLALGNGTHHSTLKEMTLNPP